MMPDTPLDATVSTDGLQSSRRVQIQAAILLLAAFLALAAAVLFVLNARGYFEQSQTVNLLSDDSEGVSVGMDMTFSGFPIGRVDRIELQSDGKAVIRVTVPSKDAHWLRSSSVFTLERNLVGSTKIRAFTGILTDPQLPDGARKDVLRGDAADEIPKLANSIRDILRNIGAMTDAESPLNATLSNVQTATARLSGPNGALGLLLGNEAEVKKVYAALERTNTLLARLDTVATNAAGAANSAKNVVDKADGMAAKLDARMFGESGVMNDAQATVRTLNALLADARGSLAKADGILKEVQGAATNTREATQDLNVLRADVESSLRKVDSLVGEINRKWPFNRDAEVKLP